MKALESLSGYLIQRKVSVEKDHLHLQVAQAAHKDIKPE